MGWLIRSTSTAGSIIWTGEPAVAGRGGGDHAGFAAAGVPGFYDKDPIHSNQLTEYTSELCRRLARRLENEIHRSLEYRPCDECDKNDLPEQRRE